jgi:hypothetical protein
MAGISIASKARSITIVMCRGSAGCFVKAAAVIATAIGGAGAITTAIAGVGTEGTTAIIGSAGTTDGTMAIIASAGTVATTGGVITDS